MSNDINAAKQSKAEDSKSTDNIMNDIQAMIGNLLQNTVNKMQKADISEEIGGSTPNSKADAAADVELADLKNFVDVMQKFIDNVNIMIAGLETGISDPKGTDEKFLDGYMATADNVLEIAAFSMKDSLTGLSNRYGFDSRLIYEWNRASRDKSPLTLAIFGVAGYIGQRDDVYKAVSKRLLKSIKRSTDFIARWDEDEFAVLLPTTDKNGAKIVVERILAEIEVIPDVEKKDGKLSVSIGACVHTPLETEKPTDFIGKAHKAFEKARASEKSTVVYEISDQMK